MLVPFRNVTRLPANDWLITGAPLMLSEALGQFTDLSIVSDQRLTAAMRRFSIATDVTPDATQLRRLADETDGWTVITGNVVATGARLQITAQATDIVTSAVIAKGSTDVATDADPREAFDRLTAQLLQGVGVRGAATDLTVLTTKSIDAYRSYVEGTSFTQRGAYRRAQTAFREAVRRDSTFALAWADLAIVVIQVGGANELFAPMGSASRAADQAFRNSSKLPARRAGYIRVMHHTFRGEFGRAHRLADSLVATDGNDVVAREWLALVELIDSRLDSTKAYPVRMGSLNRVVAMAKIGLELDPSRFELYGVPAEVYAFTAGFMGPPIFGIRKEAGSLASSFLNPDVYFVPVLRDTIVNMVDTAYMRLPLDERVRLRTHAADAGLDWTNQWLVTAPNDPEANLWASRFEEARGDFPAALLRQQRAESLGVESNLENNRSRRLSLLELSGRHAAAERLADSIFESGGLRFPPLVDAWFDRGRMYATAVYLRSKQWNKAAALAKLIGPPGPAQHACESLSRQLAGNALMPPPSELRAITDSVAMHFGDVVRVPDLNLCADELAGRLYFDSTAPPRTAAVRALLAAADSLHRAGNDAFAFRAARIVWDLDFARRDSLVAVPWFNAYAKRVEVPVNFAPGTFDVFTDSAVMTLRFIGKAPFMIDPLGIGIFQSFNIAAKSVTGSDTTNFAVRLTRVATSSDSGLFGGVADLVKLMGRSQASIIQKPPAGSPIPAIGPDIIATGDGIRVVVRGPIATELRRTRPVTASFGAACLLVRDGLCAIPWQSVVIQYH